MKTLDLFVASDDEPANLLPRDGTVNYHGPIMPRDEADHWFHVLSEDIAWDHDEAIIFGKRIVTKRKVAWYADQPFSYTYSGSTKTALPWRPALLSLKALVESQSAETYNSCLLNLYHDGTEGMAWHSDAEKDLKRNGAIGSLSFGAERRFAFKHKRTKQTVDRVLEHGSLLVMKDTTQSHWLHRLPPTRTVSIPRINLTFRTIV
jgi:alkylated DNA repair dioxygenase AlkB